MTDCNVFMNAMSSGLPRIGNDTCRDFENTALNYIGNCIRSGQPATQFQSFADVICQSASAAVVHVNMSLDTSSEHSSCGYGSLSRNATAGVWNAFQHCNPSVRGADPNDPCCLYDPAIVKAIKEGGLQLLPDIPDFTCEIYFSKSLQVSCGTIVGSVLFAVMSVMSVLIVWGRVWLARGICGRRHEEEEDDVGDWRKNVIVDESIHPSARAWGSDSVAGASHDGRSKRHSAALSEGERHTGLGAGAEGPKRHSAVIAMARFEDAETGISPQGSGKGRGRPSSLTPVALRPMGAGYSPVSAGVGTSMGRPPFATNGRGSSRSEQGSAKSSGVEPAPASAQSSGIDPGLGLIGTIHVPSVLEGYRAAYEFKGQVDQGEMEQLSAGDRVQVLGAVGNGMVAAKNLESGQHGAIPLNILGRY
ncbi:hypothetical protein BC830DRAFT_133856 [Chytriomyces sp. MP71]|nr:hypothetical protein BC830DRAFT_133856 [Chytriomyces sp. MP71]